MRQGFIERGLEMDSRDIGLLIGGFAVKAMGAALAIYVAISVGEYIINVFSVVNTAMNSVG